MTTRIKLRRDDTTNWEALNPVLALGEPGYNTTENKIKIGDGVTAWIDLAYLTDATGTSLTPATTNTLGGVKLGEGFVLNGSNQVTTSKLYSTNLSDPNVHYRLTLDTNGVVVLPDQSIINGSTMRGIYGTGELNYTGITIGPDADHQEESWVWVDASGAHVGTSFSTDAHTWDFKNDGNLQLPAGGYIVNSNGDDILAGLGGGGGGADLGSFTIESNVLKVDSGTDIYIETYETGGEGESRLVLKPQDDGVNNPTRLEGSYGVGIWSNTTSAGDSINKWLFDTDGVLTLPRLGTINFVDPVLGGFGTPNASTRTPGNRIVLYPSFDGLGQVDYAIGINGATQWYSVPDSNAKFEWYAGENKLLSLGGNGIEFSNGSYIKQQQEEGLIIWQPEEGGDNNDAEYVALWYGGDAIESDSPNVSITAGSYNWATDDGSRYLNGGEGGILDYTNYVNDNADQGPRQINLDIVTQDGGAILNWHFDESGNLYLPADPSVVGTSGIVFGDGTVQTTAGGGGGTGNVTIASMRTIGNTAAGIELTIASPVTEWYSIYGDIGTSSWSNATSAGSVVHDTGGNIYVLGSTVDYANINDGNNLFLKYDTKGVLDWSRTWTDQAGMDCGSFNTSMRFLPATTGTSDQETIYWNSFNPWNIIAYVGTMDTDGELVDGYGDARAPVQMINVRLADLEVAAGSNVHVVGARFGVNNANATPLIATVNLDTHTANSAVTISPPYIDITNTGSETNFFKSVCDFNGNVVAVGTYYQNDVGYHWPILTSHTPGGDTRTYHLTASSPNNNYYGEAVVNSSFHEALYVITNNTEGTDFGTIGKLANDFSEYTWMCRFGDNGVDVFLLGMTIDEDGNIYILGELPNVDNTDFVLIKMTDSAEGVVWQRKIGSSEYDGSGRSTFGSTGWQSSTGISVQGDHVVIVGITSKLNGGQPNAFTIKYPTDGSLTGDFGQYHAVEFDCGVVSDWMETINDLTNGTTVTAINGNAPFIADINEASLIATTKTLDAGYEDYHWDMTNNRLYFSQRKWIFGEDGTLTLPSAATLYEDEPNTLIIRSKGGSSLNYAKYDLVSDAPRDTVLFSGVASTQNGVTVTVNKKLRTDEERVDNTWQFRDNGGLQFPDGTTQYGATLDQELALDGGSAVSTFITVSNPRLADGGGSGARYGSTAPNYDGATNGATTNPNEFTLLLNGGGA